MLLLLLLRNLLRERRHRLMISKSTASGGKRSTGKDQRDLRWGKLGSTATEQRRRGAASYLDTSRRGRDETATHTGKGSRGKRCKRETLDFNILFPLESLTLYMR